MSKNNKSKAPAPGKPAAKPTPVKVPPLFRRIDWTALLITFGIVWAIYLLTLAPEQTLEDSGELCTGAFYAGIPHPPGYPFWSVYAWFWTWILPFRNVAWRVEVGESFAIAMGCGLVSLMVSRGGSMIMEGIEALKNLPRQWENSICMISGCVAGLVMGMDAFMWSEAVVINRISIFAVPWLMLVLALLMRWLYAPQQRRYLYWAIYVYGLCATIHQTLLLSAMGIEVLVALVQPKLGRDMFIANSIIYLGGLMLMNTIPALHNMTGIEKALFHLVGISSIITSGFLIAKTKGFLTEWKSGLIMLGLWIFGVMFYFYEPISCMTVPPMQWGYPRTVEGFFHTLSRGQYSTATGVDLFTNPGRFLFQLKYIVQGLSESFSWVYMFIGILPFVFLRRMQRRERSWIFGLTAVYLCLSVLLGVLMDVSPDRSSSQLCKVFYTAGHSVFALLIGYGLIILAGYVATHYKNFRRWGILGSIVAIVLALFCLKTAVAQVFLGPIGDASLSSLPHYIAQAFDKNQYGMPIFANLILLAMPIIFLVALLVYRERGPVSILLGLFLIMPAWSGLSHWYHSEQHDHWFGYWYGHDMFTPPYVNPKTDKLTYNNVLRAKLLKDPKYAKLIYPQMARNAILFGGTDPGRFTPTYAIFCDSFIPHRCQPTQDQHFNRRDVYIITQNALADDTYLDYLRSQYDRSQQHDPPFFSKLSEYIFSLAVGQDEADSGIFHLINQALYYTLDVPFTKWGKHVEKERRAEGVYPANEIYIPSPEDSQNCFQEYTQDVARRARLHELEPGEHVSIKNGRVQVSGQVAVMKINGLLCKVIFDHNPTNQFYVEESFPLKWMYPYETPFGIIMKIHRHPVKQLSQAVFERDHAFWTAYSRRLCGDWINYNTSISNICKFVERVYIRNNYTGYTGDRKFVRDEDAQKAFSKLRSSQAGMYAWRLSPQCPPQYRQKTAAGRKALIRETDFAFKQAFAFCPYSPEAVYRYINFLLPQGRFNDAILIAKTCHDLDPYNSSIDSLIKNLENYKRENEQRMKAIGQINQMAADAQTNPADIQNMMKLGATYAQMKQTNKAMQIFDRALADTNLNYADAATIASFYSQIQNLPELENALKKLAALSPKQPEPHYDLAALQAYLGQTKPAMANLKVALQLNAEQLKTNPAARNLLDVARKDPHLNSLRGLPEFQKLVPPK